MNYTSLWFSYLCFELDERHVDCAILPEVGRMFKSMNKLTLGVCVCVCVCLQVVKMRSTLERFQTSKLLPLKERLGQYHYTLDVSEMWDDRYQFYRSEILQTLDRNPNCLSNCLQPLYFQWTCLSTSTIACLRAGKRFAGSGLEIRSILQVWTLR